MPALAGVVLLTFALAAPLAAQQGSGLPRDPASTTIPPLAAAVLQNVSTCWVVEPGSPAAGIAATVEFTLDRDGRVTGDITLLAHSDGADAAVEDAFKAVRRAILRCGAGGFALPPEEYDTWRVVQITFDPRELTTS